MAHDVFICHSSKDKKIADAICAKLEQNKVRCWIAPRDVVPGSDFAEAIVAAIHASKVTVFVFSANSNVSPHVSHELERAVSLGHPILPFRIDEVVPSPALEYFISSAHWLDALTPPMERHIDRLVSTVAVLLDREATPVDQIAPGRPNRSRRTLILAAVGAVVVVGAVVAGLLVALGNGSDHQTASPGPTPSATASGTPSATPDTTAEPFKDDFTQGVGAGWTWKNEDATAWRTTAQGWLEIDVQGSPPIHNILLRDAPGTSYKVKLRLRYPPAAGGFAGLVLMGDDPDTRLQFGWSDTGLADLDYRDGNLTAGGEMATKDLSVKKSREALLVLEVSGGTYRARFYNPELGDYWDMNTGALDPSFTHVGLIAFGKGADKAGTAAFDSIEFY